MPKIGCDCHLVIAMKSPRSLLVKSIILALVVSIAVVGFYTCTIATSNSACRTEPPVEDRAKDVKAGNKQYDFDHCTVIMATYKRNNLLQIMLEHLCSISSNTKTRIFADIIVVWHNIGVDIPDDIKSFSCPIPVHFKQPQQNVLYNKFVHYPEIKTQCKCTIHVHVLQY